MLAHRFKGGFPIPRHHSVPEGRSIVMRNLHRIGEITRLDRPDMMERMWQTFPPIDRGRMMERPSGTKGGEKSLPSPRRRGEGGEVF